jgi:negative regulator of replication initiation
MKMYTIEVDEEVYQFLKDNAEPFIETNPNSVLKRLLPLKTKYTLEESGESKIIFPEFPPSVLSALAQTLEMILLVKKQGMNRVRATHTVADIRGISREAVQDKYCRQLGKKSYEIDELLMDSNIENFKILLLKKYPHNETTIKEVFNSIRK